jgi:hypothetical protein
MPTPPLAPPHPEFRKATFRNAQGRKVAFLNLGSRKVAFLNRGGWGSRG